MLTGNPLSMPPEGLQLFSTYVNPGGYVLMTSVTDIWGNQRSEADVVTLTEALGP